MSCTYNSVYDTEQVTKQIIDLHLDLLKIIIGEVLVLRLSRIVYSFNMSFNN
jgi:hypothetical protein